jgi:hypothetical protein
MKLINTADGAIIRFSSPTSPTLHPRRPLQVLFLGDRTPTLPSTSTTHRPACSSGFQEPSRLTAKVGGGNLELSTSGFRPSAALGLLDDTSIK